MSHSKIAVLDCGISNIANVSKALEKVGASYFITTDAEALSDCKKIILPGVGAFHVGIEFLRQKRIDDAILQAAKRGAHILGICLGMQLLHRESDEFGSHRGLGLVPGKIKKLPADRGLKVPHVGWDTVSLEKDAALLGLKRGQEISVYFTHSYASYLDESVFQIGKSDSGYGEYSSIVGLENVVGCQFHLEMSGEAGLSILHTFSKV